MKLLIIYFNAKINNDISYHYGWIKAFKESSNCNCEFVNLAKIFPHSIKFNFQNYKKIINNNYDYIIILHSAFSNSCYVPNYFKYFLSKKKAPKIYFIGNEYKLMPEKIQFSKDINISYLVTQIHGKKAIELYKKKLKCNVINIPGGGLDTSLFTPGKNLSLREIDIGFRSYNEPMYFGHQERFELMKKTHEISSNKKLKVDLSMKQNSRLNYKEYASFLKNCKSVISNNTGYDYFTLDDKLRNNIIKYCQNNNIKEYENEIGNYDHHMNNFKKIYENFFRNKPMGTSCRMISGKHIEAAGCKTPQILIEGDYGGYFLPNEHYIPVKKNFSNLNEAIEKILDFKYSSKIAENAYNKATKELTFEKHIENLFAKLN